MSNAPPLKRRQYLVDRPYQLRFVTKVFFIILAVAVASSLITSVLIWRNMYVPHEEHNLSIIAALIAIATTLVIELLLAIPLVFFFGIRQSHRIVGPLNRLKRTLQAIGEGDFTQRIILRPGDALEDLARAVNEMTERLQRRFPTLPSS